jgi:hypothetical protein
MTMIKLTTEQLVELLADLKEEKNTAYMEQDVDTIRICSASSMAIYDELSSRGYYEGKQ